MKHWREIAQYHFAIPQKSYTMKTLNEKCKYAR